MKNKLFYLFGAAFLLCSISTFTACSDDNDEPIVEVEPPIEPWELSGDYLEGTSNILKMTYNGDELTGKKVTIKADEENKKASIVLEGTEKDLGAMLAGLIDLKVKTSSPIPGEEKITLNDVTLTSNDRGVSYSFKGEDIKATRTMKYEGTIKKGELSIDITNSLSDQTLSGTWNLGEIKNSDNVDCRTASPLCIDWDTNVKVDLGSVDAGIGFPIPLNYSPNEILTMLMCWIGPGMGFDIETIIANQLKDISAEPNGSIIATYAWDSDTSNPDRWSSNMNKNIIRYYYAETAGQIYVEANVDFLVQALGSLIKTRAGNQEDLQELLDNLASILKPVLEKGFPCTYLVDGNNLKLTLDGVFARDLLKNVVKILNDPTINPLIMSLIESDETLAPYKENVKLLLETMPDALTYHDGETEKDFSGECAFVNIGLFFVKATTAE